MARWKRPSPVTGTTTGGSITFDRVNSLWNAISDDGATTVHIDHEPIRTNYTNIQQHVNEVVQIRREVERSVLDSLHFQGVQMLFPYLDHDRRTKIVRLPVEAIINGLQWDESNV